MAHKVEGKGKEAPRGDSEEPNVFESIRTIAAYNARAKLTNEHQTLLFLRSWWSTTYNRPLKDPLLLSYTFEELLYEFYDKVERQKAAQERLEQDTDKMEEAKEKEVLDWAEAEEKKELEEMQQIAAKQAADPTKDPENIKWMRQLIDVAKQQHGESFGEDIEVDFDEEDDGS